MGSSPTWRVSPLMIIHRTWLIQLCHGITHFSIHWVPVFLSPWWPAGRVRNIQLHPRWELELKRLQCQFYGTKNNGTPKNFESKTWWKPMEFPVSVVPYPLIQASASTPRGLFSIHARPVRQQRPVVLQEHITYQMNRLVYVSSTAECYLCLLSLR